MAGAYINYYGSAYELPQEPVGYDYARVVTYPDQDVVLSTLSDPLDALNSPLQPPVFDPNLDLDREPGLIAPMVMEESRIAVDPLPGVIRNGEVVEDQGTADAKALTAARGRARSAAGRARAAANRARAAANRAAAKVRGGPLSGLGAASEGDLAVAADGYAATAEQAAEDAETAATDAAMETDPVVAASMADDADSLALVAEGEAGAAESAAIEAENEPPFEPDPVYEPDPEPDPEWIQPSNVEPLVENAYGEDTDKSYEVDQLVMLNEAAEEQGYVDEVEQAVDGTVIPPELTYTVTDEDLAAAADRIREYNAQQGAGGAAPLALAAGGFFLFGPVGALVGLAAGFLGKRE